MATGDMRKKSGKVRSRGFLSYASRQTVKQTAKQTQSPQYFTPLTGAK